MPPSQTHKKWGGPGPGRPVAEPPGGWPGHRAVSVRAKCAQMRTMQATQHHAARPDALMGPHRLLGTRMRGAGLASSVDSLEETSELLPTFPLWKRGTTFQEGRLSPASQRRSWSSVSRSPPRLGRSRSSRISGPATGARSQDHLGSEARCHRPLPFSGHLVHSWTVFPAGIC